MDKKLTKKADNFNLKLIYIVDKHKNIRINPAKLLFNENPDPLV